jgi:hypothetical protein
MIDDAKIRTAAALYLEQHGEHAVEVIRGICVRAHRAGDRPTFELWRRIGIAADERLMAVARPVRARTADD